MKIRLVIWSISCLAVSVLFFGELWARLPQWLSPEGLQRHGVFHWGVLGLCVLWLWLKRKEILPRMRASRLDYRYILAGLAVLALGILLPKSGDFLVFLLLLGWLGIFTVIFGRACVIPSVLLAIYGFSVTFPLLMIRWLGEPSAVLATGILAAITGMLGLPVTGEGVHLSLSSLAGEAMTLTVTPGCAGYATVGVFLALFSLMMLDVRLPLSRAWYIFLIGLIGTWLQNIIRMVLTVAAGYYWGLEALETVHRNIAYVIYPLWYALFAYIYLRQARLSRLVQSAGGRPLCP